TGLALVANEAWRTGSAGAEIATLITENCFDYLDAPVIRVSAMDIPMPYNKELEYAALPHKQDIVNAVRKLLQVSV
ncbi:MAG: alpha-ketoacid dehydrogenase subunit beta, partial [Candidatus Gastranaerophilales bacterium]|nr:alpha-ketoacid dehydrogenase subunit beta [Candidatus Gastranaerophilales bacterium]